MISFQCFTCVSFYFLAQVQAVLRRHWNQYKIQFEHSFSHSDAMRTASYTVSSISDVQGYSYNHDCTSEHLNGKGYHDMESVVLKTEKLYGWLPRLSPCRQLYPYSSWTPHLILWLHGQKILLNGLFFSRVMQPKPRRFSYVCIYMHIYICWCFCVSI